MSEAMIRYGAVNGSAKTDKPSIKSPRRAADAPVSSPEI